MSVKVPRPARASVARFQSDPGSIRNAVRVIIVATVAVVLIGSAVMWLLDSRDFPDYGTALWFTLQTATTVGYGDVTPTSPVGRFVASLVMLFAIAFLTIVTALVTSTFIDAAQRRRRSDEVSRQAETTRQLLERIDELNERLARIEGAIPRSGGQDRD